MEIEALADAALRELADGAGAEVGAIWVARADGERPALAATRGLRASDLAATVEPGVGLAGRALAEGRVVTGDHGSAGLTVPALAADALVRRETHVPLLAEGAAFGVAALGHLSDRVPDPGETERLARLAAPLALTLAQARDTERAQRQGRLGRAVLDATPDPIALVGQDGDVLVENGPMAALRGNGIDALDALDGGGLEHEVRDLLRPEGTKRVLSRYAAPVRDSGGTLMGRIVVLRDITAERDSDRMKDEFFSLVSHELRTPLTSIIGYLELVLDGGEDLTADTRRFLEVVERNAKRLLRMVGDVLFVAEVEAGRLQLERAPVDVGLVASEAVETGRPAAERAGVELVFEAEPVRPLSGDRDRFAQMLDNLVTNAIKFTPEGGRVEVTIADEGERAILEVRDTGMGVPVAEQDRLFERFFRSSNATRQAVPGAGLGLTIVKTIVDAHGGEISLESAPGSGTRVSVAIPYGGSAGDL